MRVFPAFLANVIREEQTSPIKGFALIAIFAIGIQSDSIFSDWVINSPSLLQSINRGIFSFSENVNFSSYSAIDAALQNFSCFEERLLNC